MSKMTICGGPRDVIGISDNKSASVCSKQSIYSLIHYRIVNLYTKEHRHEAEARFMHTGCGDAHHRTF